MLQSRWLIDQTEVTARDGLVVTKDILASRAGLQMLQAGGNAVDAAVAAAFAIGVVEPWMSGIGGGGFMVAHLAKERRTVVIDYAMRGPLAGREDLYELEEGMSGELFGWRKVKDDANIWGWRAIAVPGTVAGLCEAHRRYGRLDLAQVMAPAIICAREGFPVTWHNMLVMSSAAPRLARDPESAKTWLKNGFPRVTPVSGVELIKQPDLARTLEQIAAGGPDAFYRGPIARQIAAGMAANGGLVTEEDLANYQVRVIDPAPSVSFGPYQICTSPCPSGGPTALETLAILNGSGIEECGWGTPDAIHLFAEGSRLSWADRFRHLCEPELMAFPWQNLFDPRYAATRRALIDRSRAMEQVEAGDPGALGGAPERLGGPDGSTTALVAADSEGNVVSITQTLMQAFGSAVTIPGTGMLMNDGMYWFDPEPGKANSVGPGKKPLNNMAPMVVLKDGKPFAAISSSGGRKIVDANLNICLNLINHRMGMQQAVSAPRFDASGASLVIDDRFPEEVLVALRRRGHKVVAVKESFRPRIFASPTCLRIDPVSGLLTSGTDPFHPAVALGL